MTNPLERKKIKSMSHSFANTRHTIGDNSLQFWLLEMERYYLHDLKTKIDKNAQNFYSLVLHFFNSKNTEPWASDVKWTKQSNGKLKIKAFRFFNNSFFFNYKYFKISCWNARCFFIS